MKIKYTRYDLKRKKRDNFWFFIVVIVILALSLILGSIFSKMFMKGTSSKTSPNPSINEIPYIDKNESKSNDVKSSSEDKKSIDNNIKEINPSKGKKIKYVAVQEGMYQNESYVNESIKKLNEFGNPFIISEGNGKRILLGIYVEEQSGKIIKTLTDKKIENSKVVFEVKCEDVCDLQIVEIINAYIQVLNKLSEKNVKSIQTKDVKSWCASLQGAKDNDKNIKLLNELKDKINKLPNEITRDKASENYVFLYNLLKKLS